MEPNEIDSQISELKAEANKLRDKIGDVVSGMPPKGDPKRAEVLARKNELEAQIATIESQARALQAKRTMAKEDKPMRQPLIEKKEETKPVSNMTDEETDFLITRPQYLKKKETEKGKSLLKRL